jgi:hypothetical protein
MYQTRFQSQSEYRRGVWRILVDGLFRRWIRPTDRVIDLGAGHGEFINAVEAAEKWAIDLNPDCAGSLQPGITHVHQSCADRWPFADGSIDVVFTSNFFEHLPNKELVRKTCDEAFRTLRSGGSLIAMGPNSRLLPGDYWDFWDHYLPLTERSLAELGRLCGFETAYINAATLPYSMSQGFRPPLWCLRLYLQLPLLWRFFGKQFLVVLRKP